MPPEEGDTDHAYVLYGAVPAEAVAYTLSTPLLQSPAPKLLAVAVGTGLTVSVAVLAVTTQPLLSVTVRVYEPLVAVLMAAVLTVAVL